MKKVKITVLKTTLDEELAAEYGAEGLGPCPMLREGQVFYADYAKPDGLCDEAWKAIYQYVFALAHGAGEGLFYYGDWIRRPGVAICSCNDGLRPVIFKLETTEEEASVTTHPCGKIIYFQNIASNFPLQRKGAAMLLPKDPYILLSFLNARLRDQYADLEDLCASLDADEQSLRETLAGVDYRYDPVYHQFIPITSKEV